MVVVVAELEDLRYPKVWDPKHEDPEALGPNGARRGDAHGLVDVQRLLGRESGHTACVGLSVRICMSSISNHRRSRTRLRSGICVYVSAMKCVSADHRRELLLTRCESSLCLAPPCLSIGNSAANPRRWLSQ